MELLEYFKELTIHPKNAKELKGLILQLAIQGKLTKKWRNENKLKIKEEDIFNKIQDAKKRILIESKVKKEKPVEPFNNNDTEFELPKNWIWSRFASFAYIVRGGSPRPIKSYLTDDSKGLNWIKIGDTKGVTKYIETTSEKILKEGLKKSRYVKPSDFILSNSMSFGRPYIMKTDGCIHDGWLLIREPSEIIFQDYLYYLLLAPYTYSSFKDSAAGGVVQNLNIEKVRQTLLPIPPLEEQKAIVEIVEQLFTEVEQLEAQTKLRIQLKEDYVSSALRNLSTQPTEQAWASLIPHFKEFFTEKSAVKKLRETVLQLAVQGKLTKKWRVENPDVEPASVLLEKIKAEKEQLIKDKKIKKEKPLAPITADEIPYELPEGWEWCHLGEIAEKLGAGSTPSGGKTAYVDDGIKFFRSQNIYNDGIRIKDIAQIRISTHNKMSGTHIYPKDILLNITGGSIGRSSLIPDDFDAGNVSQHVAIVRLIDRDMRHFIHNYIISPEFQDRIMDVQVGVSREGLSMTKLKVFPTPVPPLSEQKEIVEIVNALMAFCDQLEEAIEESTIQIEQLMQSCLKEVFEG